MPTFKVAILVYLFVSDISETLRISMKFVVFGGIWGRTINLDFGWKTRTTIEF